VRLDQFVGYRTDAIWGRQTVQRSLRGILGTDTASQFYSRNQGRGGRPAVAPVGPNLSTAATIQDLRDFMSAKYPHMEFDPSVQGIRDTEQIFPQWRVAVSEFDRLATKFPNEAQRLQAFRGQRAGDRRSNSALATAFWGDATNPRREIVLRKLLMSDPAMLQPYQNPNSFGGLFVQDYNEVRTATVHEFGHIVDFARAFRGNTAFARPLDVGDRAPLPIDGASVGGTIQQMRNRFIAAVRSPRRSNTLSQYGMSDPYEVMAEAFVAREYIPQGEWTELMQVFDSYMKATDLSRISPAP
jgi:hypothetical protein